LRVAEADAEFAVAVDSEEGETIDGEQIRGGLILIGLEHLRGSGGGAPGDLVALALKDAGMGKSGREDDFIGGVGAGGVGTFFEPKEAGDGEPTGITLEFGFILRTLGGDLVRERIGG